jgi:Predicted oxidoreductases (related to aryl-alcohol dehydrogenases)
MTCGARATRRCAACAPTTSTCIFSPASTPPSPSRSPSAPSPTSSPQGRWAVSACPKSRPPPSAAPTPRYNGENLTANLSIVDAITHLASAGGTTPAQIALAWLLSRGRDVIPIPGSSRRPHLRDNLAALDLHLTCADLDQIDAAVPEGGAHGARYGDHGTRLIDQ